MQLTRLQQFQHELGGFLLFTQRFPQQAGGIPMAHLLRQKAEGLVGGGLVALDLQGREQGVEIAQFGIEALDYGAVHPSKPGQSVSRDPAPMA